MGIKSEKQIKGHDNSAGRSVSIIHKRNNNRKVNIIKARHISSDVSTSVSISISTLT
jgi:phosphoribosylanthranilate isomerase